MKGILLIGFLCFWAGISLPQSLAAQQVRPLSREALDSLVYPPLMVDADKVLRFSDTVRDFGTVSETHPELVFSYSFHNVSADTIRITRVRTLCGCTKSDDTSREVPPGMQDSITVRFLPLGKIGKVHQKVYLYATVSAQPVACLEIIGQVTEQ